MEKQEAVEVSEVKVLHTNFLRGWGGQSNRVLTESVGLAEIGYDVLISAPPGSQLAKRSEEAGLPVETSIGYAGGLRWKVLGDVLAMRRLLVSYQPDIVHLHGGRDSWVYAKAAALLRTGTKPVVIRTKHNVFPISDHPLNRWQYGKSFDSLVALSTAIKDQLVEKPYVDADKVRIIPSAIRAQKFDVQPGTRDRLRREFGFSSRDIVIGITGRLRHEKGHDVLFDALPEVLRQCPQAKLICFGSGSLKGEFARQLATLGIENAVTLTGFRTDVPDCLAALDIYVQPSRSEGLGTSVLEASAARLPVVASRTGGIPDVIIHENTGLLVEPENSAELAKAIIRLAEDRPLRENLAQNARRHVQDVFSVEKLVAETDQLYQDLAGARISRISGG